MAVETKQPLNQTITGVVPAANGTPAVGNKRKRPSSLLQVASTLPSVENSLEEFIAKANQTLVDVGNWGTDKVKEQEDEKRKEIDALRWKAAETQLRESEHREGTLRRQLDSLQGKLAETEARAAVAAESGQHSPADDVMISELRMKIARAEEKALSADMRARAATDSLAEARSSRSSFPSSPAIDAGDTVSDDRIRHAEAKAAKALAAARAIQAGLNVSSADLAAIESGLIVPEQTQKKTPWLAIAGAFVVGIAIMFVVTKVVMKDSTPAPAAAAAAAPTPTPAPTAVTPAPMTPPAPAVVAKPIVTPIEEPKPDEQAVAPTPTPTPAPTPAPVPEKVAPAPAPAHHAAAAPAHAAVAHAAPAHAAAAPAHAAPAPAKKAPAATAPSNIADPFADPPAKKPAAPAKKPAAGAIADPF